MKNLQFLFTPLFCVLFCALFIDMSNIKDSIEDIEHFTQETIYKESYEFDYGLNLNYDGTVSIFNDATGSYYTIELDSLPAYINKDNI